jgi:hypothetical protein
MQSMVEEMAKLAKQPAGAQDTARLAELAEAPKRWDAGLNVAARGAPIVAESALVEMMLASAFAKAGELVDVLAMSASSENSDTSSPSGCSATVASAWTACFKPYHDEGRFVSGCPRVCGVGFFLCRP